MQELLHLDNWKSYFKYFSFRFKKMNTRRIHYHNAIYEGQVQFNEKKNSIVRHGVGTFLTNKGLFYYGQFNNDRLEGEGNFLMPEGHFLRGNFKKGKLHGLSLYMKRNGDIYILKFKYGILNSKVTFFPGEAKEGYLLQFGANKFRKVLKRYEFGSNEPDKAKYRVIRSVFENSQLNEVLYTASDVQKVLKKAQNKDSIYINSHLIGKEYAYCGMFDIELGFKGLGLLLGFGSGKVKIGLWNVGEMEGYGFIHDKKYSFIGGFKANQMHGEVLVRNLATDDYKLCLYEKGAFKKVLEDGKGNTDFVLFSFNKKSPGIPQHNKGYYGFSDKKFEYYSLDALGYSLSNLNFTKDGVGTIFNKQTGNVFESPPDFIKETPRRTLKAMSPHSNKHFVISARETAGPLTREKSNPGTDKEKRKSGFGDVPLKMLSSSSRNLRSQKRLHKSCLDTLRMTDRSLDSDNDRAE